MFNKSNEEKFEKLIIAIKELGWDVIIPAEDDASVEGLIIGEPHFIEEFLGAVDEENITEYNIENLTESNDDGTFH